jgi:peptidoglycan/LPS O-acetylase OafA/YrhL
MWRWFMEALAVQAGKLPLNKIGRIPALDSVRGIAAFIVVIHHCFLTRPVYSDFFFTQWRTPATGPISAIFLHTPARIVWAGYEAVTLFYVLSGLVLALPWVEGRPPAYREFAIKRMCRLYIPYVVIIALAGVLDVAFQPHAVVSGASKWVNEMTWSQPVTPFVIFDHLALIGHHYTINGVTHTLIWEIRESLLFPLLIVPICRWGVRGAVAVWGCLAALIVSLQLIGGNVAQMGELLTLTHHSGLITRVAFELQWTAYYAGFFVIGGLIAARIPRIRQFFSGAGAWLSFLLLLSGLLIFQGHWSHWPIAQEYMVAFGSVLILCAALAPGRIETMLLKRFPRYLGRISFSLYLVHVPVILMLTILTHGALSLPLLIAIVVPVSIALAAAFERTVTAPSASLGHRLAQASHDARFAQQPVLEQERV